MKQQMTIDFVGRIKNFPLPKRHALVPMFEAVVNSIQAIEDRRENEPSFKGSVTVRIHREPVLSSDSEEIATPHVDGFTIIDDGIGFNKENFESFLKSDSQYKSSRGGKGVGRFCWLKAFDNVHVMSCFQEEEGHWYKREFDFNLHNYADIDDGVTDSDSQTTGTEVSLQRLSSEYAAHVPDEARRIAIALMYHCLVYLLNNDCPTISVVDGQETFIVNSLFATVLSDSGEKSMIRVERGKDRIELQLLCLKFDYKAVPHGAGTHVDKLILCANSRGVREIPLDKKLNGLTTLMHEQHAICFVGVVSGDYLDDNVDMNRLSFTFPEEDEDLFYGVSEKDIVDSAIAASMDFLRVYREEADSSRAARVQAYVGNEAPQYKPLVAFATEELSSLPYNANDNDIDGALHQARRRLEQTVKKENGRLLKRLDDGGSPDTPEDMQEYSEQLRRVAMYNQTALAEYVIHRKTVLDFFERGLRKDDSDGKFQKERYLHNLIYPMQASSEDTPEEAHNLWLIDERLTYSSLITSDQSLEYEDHRDRPDILVLDSPVVMSLEENNGRNFDSVIIFELKRPMRDDYNGQDNPINQLLGYAKQIRSNKAADRKGRPIHVNDQTRMYLYAVCDITPSLESILSNYDFTSTPDGLGRYQHNKSLNAYIEVISFDKLVNDAKMRNGIFFRKLQID